MKNRIEPIYNVLRNILIVLFKFLPIKQNKIVFIQTDGGGYKCNLKYIAQEIIRQRLPYDMVWMVNDFNEPIPDEIRKVKYNRICAVYELATAHIVINNLKSYIPVCKKHGQVFIYIPHGQPGAKCAEGDAIISDEYKEMSKKHSALTDIFVSMGSYHTQVLRETFWVPENAEILECGFPRNDIYYRDTSIIQKRIRQDLKIDNGVSILYYAPTFRDHGSSDCFNLDINRILDVLEKKTQKRWICFTTLHPNFQYFAKPAFDYSDRIIDMTSYLDLHELFLVVDIVITDYSSVSLDFSNTRRPVFLYASDVEEYKKLRGLKSLFYKFPFTLCINNDQLENAILTFDYDDYLKRLESFYSVYGSVDDGHASERFVERLKSIIDV